MLICMSVCVTTPKENKPQVHFLSGSDCGVKRPNRDVCGVGAVRDVDCGGECVVHLYSTS